MRYLTKAERLYTITYTPVKLATKIERKTATDKEVVKNNVKAYIHQKVRELM